MTETELIERYSIFGKCDGGEFFLMRGKALEFTLDCVSNGLAVLGLECFRFQGGEVQSDTGLIADFSSLVSLEWEEMLEQSREHAERFLGELSDPDLFIVFTLFNEEEWKNQRNFKR
ncbi:MAG: hypothetical protein AAF492_04300 [Verrucomicrobiota bacterium]